jgi:hypothetical protein
MSVSAQRSIRMRAELGQRRSVHVAWWWCIAAVVGLSLGLLWWSFDLQRQRRQIEAERAAAQALAAAASAAVIAPRSTVKPYEASAREMLAQATTPWPVALSALESVQLPGVRVLRFDYIASEARVSVALHLTEQRQAVDYVNELNTGVPAEGAAWRWTLSGVELDRSTGSVRADVVGLWRTKPLR